MTEGIAILLLAQLNRSAQEKDDPSMAALKNSGSLEEDSDVVLLISPADGTTNIDLAKNRNGRTGTIRCDFNGEKYHFTEL